MPTFPVRSAHVSGLHQKDAAGVRTDTEAELFKRALNGLSEWYGHPKTYVFKLTRLPPRYPAGFTFPAGITPNQAGYHDRGWVRETAEIPTPPGPYLATHARLVPTISIGMLDLSCSRTHSASARRRSPT